MSFKFFPHQNIWLFVHSVKSQITSQFSLELTVLKVLWNFKEVRIHSHGYKFYSLNLSRFIHCSVIKVLLQFVVFNNFNSLSYLQVVVNNFFILFLTSFDAACRFCDSSFILPKLFCFVNNFFELFFVNGDNSMCLAWHKIFQILSAVSATACL